MNVGVLALQGAFIEHQYLLTSLGVDTFQIRKKSDLEQMSVDGIILPGGESTSIGTLLHELDLFFPLQEKIKQGLPVFGTCAGLILLAKSISANPEKYFSTMDIVVKRNAYGRQLGSFSTIDSFNNKPIPMTFIRAPYIESTGENVSILSIVQNRIVAVRENFQLACAFHPELTRDPTVHTYFLDMIRHSKKLKNS